MPNRKPTAVRPGAEVERSVSDWLCVNDFEPSEARQVVNRLQLFAHAASKAKHASIGLLAGVGNYGHRHLWVNVAWPGLDLDKLDRPSQTREIRDMFAGQFGKVQPHGLTVHLEYVAQEHLGSLERHLRSRAAKEGRTFLVVYSDPRVKAVATA